MIRLAKTLALALALAQCEPVFASEVLVSHGVDTVHDQIIGGSKSFTQPVAADITGNAATSGSATQAGTSLTSGSATISGSSALSGTANYATTSGSSATSGTATYAISAGNAATSGSATQAGISLTSGSATISGSSALSGTANYATTSGSSATSGTATYAISAGNAATSGSATQAGTSLTSGSATVSGSSALSGTANYAAMSGSSATSGTAANGPGGSFGTAAYQPTSAFDIAGAAVSVQMVSLQKSSNLSDLANAATARGNLGLGTSATASMTAFDLSGTAAAQITALHLGTSSTASMSAFEPAVSTGSTTQFWRGDKTWQIITPAGIGAVPSTGGTFSGTIVNGTTTSLTLTSGTLTIMSGTNRFGLRTDSGNGGQVLLDFPGGSMAFYSTGGSPYVYLAGTVQADYLIGNITGLTINSSGLTGVIPSGVIAGSLPQWLQSGSSNMSDNASVAWPVKPIGLMPPVGTVNTTTSYFLRLDASTINTAIGGTALVVAPQAQWIAAPIVASASLDYPSIAANSEATLTITATGAVVANNPTVSLGWSAALPDGVVVKQAWVSSNNTISIRVRNTTGSAIDPSAVTCKVIVQDF